MPNAHLIYIPFTGVGLGGGFKSQKWFKHRVEIFKEYTLKSLANQSNKNFLLWCSFRPEEEFKSTTKEIWNAIEDAGLEAVFTFNGLVYHDDKFTVQNLKTRFRNFLKMFWDGFHEKDMKPFSQIIKYTWESKNRTLPERVSRSIATLKSRIGCDYEWVLMTRLDSDDMLHRDAVDLIQSSKPGYKKALVMDKGYMYNTITGQLGEWLPPTNPPFHTICFTRNDFFDSQKHVEYYGDFKSHEDIPRVFSCETLDMYKYCVTAHGTDHISTAWDVPLPKRVYQSLKYARPYCYTTSGRNLSTRWESRTLKKKNRMLGKEFFSPEKEEIIKQFGI